MFKSHFGKTNEWGDGWLGGWGDGVLGGCLMAPALVAVVIS